MAGRDFLFHGHVPGVHEQETAGPQDRVIQAHQGLLWMDFSRPRDETSYVALDPALLPPLFVAWDRAPGTSSTVVHDDVRSRFDRGDPEVTTAIAAARASLK